METAQTNYFTLENESARLAAIEELYKQDNPASSIAWNIMCAVPTRLEKSRLAHVLRTRTEPDSDWSLATVLTYETDQDVVGNAINALTQSKNRALGHRLVRLFSSPERPQRILYCLARYAEEAIDPRFACYLAPTLAHDLSDAFLARTFNALFRLGVKDEFAIQVASELIRSHIDATNMDRKAAVSAVLYLCFAGNQKQLEQLWNIKDNVAIPELRRLLNWGHWHILQIGKNNFNEQDAEVFLKDSFKNIESNYTGYGCFKLSDLANALATVLKNNKDFKRSDITRGILGLAAQELTEILAQDEKYGLDAAAKEKDEHTLTIWKEYAPFSSTTFSNHLRNPKFFDIWHSQNPELLFCVLTTQDFDRAGVWNEFLKKELTKSTALAADIFCAALFAMERALIAQEKVSEALIKEYVALLNEIKSTVQKNKESQDSLCNRVYGVAIGAKLPQGFFKQITEILPVDECPWSLEALAVTPKFIDSSLWQYLCQQLILRNNKFLKDGHIDEKVFVSHLLALEQAILFAFEKNGLTLDEKLLGDLEELVTHTQVILNTIHQPQEKSSDEEENDFDENADWAGQVHRDVPLLRWNAVLQTALNKKIDKTLIKSHEAVLVDSIRVAPHVDKRWIVHALAKLSTDDAIKAILYGAFQHVDGEFVAHTIRELLHSKHPRAQQALIRCVGRNTIADDLKLTILEEISLENPDEILQELKTLEILRLPQHIDDAVKDAIGRVAALVKTSPNSQSPTHEPETIVDVDNLMRSMLPDADSLSVDALSALRTAEMILVQSKSWRTEAVDLSPIVNMHFKAVELTMRENFEAYTDAVIRKGLLSRKLDIVGYARPIPEKMQVFEDYLASLPIIKTIPYFSKFKLRKMLRAICLYRPGKRFTLDGPKAFALFFLVCARRQCQFGLEKIIDLPYKTDNELFEFIKLVHSLQDSRNRAVHEGLTWEAKDEIEAFKKQAYLVIENCIKLGKHLKHVGET